MRKELPQQLLRELLKNSKRSDRELAKVLGVSQPTITRMRTRLVKQGVIKEFTVIPDFAKMGYEIIAVCCVKTKTPVTELTEKGMKWMKKYPNMIFAAAAEGMGKNGVIISLHKSYSDFHKFVSESRLYWGEEIQDYGTMLITLKQTIPKPLSLKYLAEEENPT
ncbi:MAG: Lrp/AsnC family transcriptional regulator [Candidatus Bathyarchaeia archaeon]